MKLLCAECEAIRKAYKAAVKQAIYGKSPVVVPAGVTARQLLQGIHNASISYRVKIAARTITIKGQPAIAVMRLPDEAD